MKKSKCYYVIILLFLSILFRIPEIVRNPYTISNDSRDYYHVAVNVVRGNGYSNATEPPYEPYFFREPVYPLFLASFLLIPSVLGYNPSYLEDPGITDPIKLIGQGHSLPMWEKLYLKIVQLLLDSVCILIIYAILKNFYERDKAFRICILISFFSAFIGLYADLIRESVQLFLMVVLTYFLYRYSKEKSYSTIIFIGIILGLLSLTLQIFILLIPLFIIFIIFSKMNIRVMIKHILLILIFSGMLICPWVIRSYLYARDWRVIKTMGMSLTFEQLGFLRAYKEAENAKVINDNDLTLLKFKYYFNASQSDYFKYSYNGKYTQLSDSLYQVIRQKSQYKGITGNIKIFFSRFLFLFIPRIYYTRLYSGFKTFLFAIVAIIGLFPGVKLFKKYKFIWPLLLFHLLIFYNFGDESRRLVYMHYFWSTMAAIGIVEIFYYYKKCRNAKDTEP